MDHFLAPRNLNVEVKGKMIGQEMIVRGETTIVPTVSDTIHSLLVSDSVRGREEAERESEEIKT